MGIGVLISLVALIVFFYYKTQHVQKKLSPAERMRQLDARTSPAGLRVGDIVTHLSDEYIVEGKLTYTEEGWSWTEFLLVDGDKCSWLSVEDDDRLSVAFNHEVDGFSIDGPPGAELTVGGTVYLQKEKGRAQMSREGRVGRKSGGVCHYYEYRSTDGRKLSVEQWGSSYSAYLQEPVDVALLDILPGS